MRRDLFRRPMSTAVPESSEIAPPPRISPLVFIFATIFLDLLGVGLLVPVLPFIIAKFRPDALTVGLLSSSYAIAQFLAAPVLGALSDRFGRRPVLLLSMLGTAAGYFLFGFTRNMALEWVLPVMYLSRLIDGVTGAVVSSAQAYIADVSKPEDRTKNFGLVGVAFGLGFIFGPAIGGVLGRIDLYLPVWFAGGFAIANAVLGYFTVTESLQPEMRHAFGLGDFNPFRQLLALFRNPRVRGLVTGFVLFNVAFAGFTGVFGVFLRDVFHWGPGQTAGLFASIGIALAIVQGGLLRRLVPRFGEPKLLIYGLVVAIIAFLLITVVPSANWYYATQVILAAGVGVAMPSMRGLISNRVSGREQGKTIGGTQGLMSLSQMLGPLWATAAYDYIGHYSPFWIAIALILTAIAFLLPAVRME